MKRLLSLVVAAALAAVFTPSILAQPAGYALITDPLDPNLVEPVGTYVIAEYYCGKYGFVPYSINGLAFTNNYQRVGGTQYSQGALNFGTSQDAANLALISEGSQYASSFDFTVPTVAGHNYLLELLFHDDAWSSPGKRVFSVFAGPQGSATNVLYANMDLVTLGAGLNDNEDVLLRYVLNNSSGSPLEIKMSASVNNALISGLLLLDVTAPTVPPVLLVGPTNQTIFAGFPLVFQSLAVGPPGLSYRWLSDAGSPGTFSNLSDGNGISGSATATLTLSNVTSAEQANYEVTVSDTAGSVTSSSAALTVQAIPGLSAVSGPQNLNTSGNFVVAEYYGANNGPLTVNGLTFVNNNARLGSGNGILTANLPNFGSTSSGTNLALISESDLFNTNGQMTILLPTVAGRNYSLQLLFHENFFSTAGSRVFNVNAGLQSAGIPPLWAQNLDFVDMGAFGTNPMDALLTTNFTGDGTSYEIDLIPVVQNPMISALTLQDLSGTPVPPYITIEPPPSTNLFAGRNLTLSVVAGGTPLNYQWQSDGSIGSGIFANLSNGGNLSGSTAATLTITNITLGQSADYQVVITNLAGSATSSMATVTVLPSTVISPGTNYAYASITNNAVDYWRLNEPAGSPLVYDSGPGAKDGVVPASLSLGNLGPEPPSFPGFEANNTCMQSVAGYPNEYVTTPALNLNTNMVTMLAWLYPSAVQSAGAGIMLSRQGTNATFNSGLTYGVTLQPSGDYSLRYFWNGASADSGLQVPQNMWSLVALVVTPTNAVIYVVNTNGLTSWTQAATNAICPFSNPFLIGNDTFDNGTGARTFTGSIDEVAVFNSALTTSQILGLFIKASGVSTLPPTATAPTALTIVNPGATVTLSSTISGTPAPACQWMKRPLGLTGPYVNVVNGSGISGAQTPTLTISGATAANIGDYVLAVSNKVGTATSPAGRVLVVQQNPSALVGQWLTGGQSLADVSGFDAPGVHDGVFVGAGTPSWVVGDVPPGFDTSLSSLQLDGASAVAITNSAQTDSDYRLTFDNNITNRFSIAFWAKGFPATGFAPFCTKNGETPGWQLRRNNSTSPYGGATGVPTFTVRGIPDPDVGNGASARYIDSVPTWHHYVGTYDSSTGVRHLYMDGVDVLDCTGGWAGMSPANTYHMVIGAKENPGLGNWFAGSFFDVRFYNYAVTPAEVQAMRNPSSANSVGLYLDATTSIPQGQPEAFTVLIPIGANASGPITVWITNNTPSVATIRGATGNVFAVTFSAGAPVTQTFILDTKGAGTISLSAGASGGLNSATLAGAAVVPRGMIGHWLSGAANLTETSGFMPPGTHDGVTTTGTSIGGGPAPTFVSDVPAGFAGQSLALNGIYAVTINGSSTLGTGYQPTFDADIAEGFSVTFWAKGTPNGSFGPWFSKGGSGGSLPGWAVRELSTLNVPTFTVRETGDNAYPDTYSSPNLLTGFNATWHHFAATWDSLSGMRKLYIDGKLSFWLGQDYGPMPSASYDYLTIGGVDKCDLSAIPAPTINTNYFNGRMFDVRVYNYALNASEVPAIMSPNTVALTAGADTAVINQGYTGTISFSLPALANASQPVTVWVTNLNPSVVSIAGAPSNVFSVTFPAGAFPTEQLTLTGLSQGQATIAVGAPGLTSASATVQVNAGQLLGHWLVGSQSLADYSGFMPPTTHDGYAVGTAANLAYSTDVPAGFPGHSLNLNGTYAILITNSAATDFLYAPTFDDTIANRFTIAFWTKTSGQTKNYVAWVSKHGDDGIGFQVRRNAGNSYEDFCIRETALHSYTQNGSAGVEDTAGTPGLLYNGVWHHVAAVYDGYNGTRQLYVDGALEPTINLTGDYGPFALAGNHHLVLGSEENNTVGTFGNQNGYLTGLMYDVRIYNYPLTLAQINSLRAAPAPPTITAKRITSRAIQLSWSSAYPGYSLQTNSGLHGGWSTSGVTATLQNGQYFVNDVIGAGPKYYRLILQ